MSTEENEFGLPPVEEGWREITDSDYSNLRKLRIFQKGSTMVHVINAGIDRNSYKRSYHLIFENISLELNAKYQMATEDELAEILGKKISEL